MVRIARTCSSSSWPAMAAGAPAQSTGATERVSLTVSEQRARQALRVAAHRQKLEALREQALADLDAGVRQERERVAQRISDAEFLWRRDGQGLAELTWVEGERGAGPNMRAFGGTIQGALVRQLASNQGASLAGEEADEDGLAPLEEVI
jgi:hypothetical protein